MNQSDVLLEVIRSLLEKAESCGIIGPQVAGLIRSSTREAFDRQDVPSLIRVLFQARLELVNGSVQDLWQECVSTIGRRTDHQGALTYDYFRSDQNIATSSSWHRYFPWVASARLMARPLLHSSGMSSIATVFASLQLIARSSPMHLVSTDLYFETRQIIQRLSAVSQIRHEEVDDEELRTFRPVADALNVIYLDSGGQSDSLSALSDLARLPRDRQPALVIWDNSLLPACSAPVDALANWTIPMVVVRSLHKMDQLGVELASCGMCALVTPRRVGTVSASILRSLAEDLGTSSKLLGTFAEPRSVRILGDLLTPCDEIARIVNKWTIAANRRLYDRLRGVLADGAVTAYPHSVFVTVEVKDLTQVGAERLCRAISDAAAADSLPIMMAPSVGFPFTALTSHIDPARPDAERPVLRIAAGYHDSDLCDRVSDCVIAGVTGEGTHG